MERKEVANLFRTVTQGDYEEFEVVAKVEGVFFSVKINRKLKSYKYSYGSREEDADVVKKIKSLAQSNDPKGLEEVCLQAIEKDEYCKATTKIFEDKEKTIQFTYDPHENSLPYFFYEEEVNDGYRTRMVLRPKGKNEFLFLSNDAKNFFRTLFYHVKAPLSKFAVFKEESRFSYFTPTRLFEEFLALRSGLKVDEEVLALLENPKKLKDFFRLLSKTYIDFVSTLKVNEAFEERIKLNGGIARLTKIEETIVTYDKGLLKLKKEKEGISLFYYDEKEKLAGYWLINEKGNVERDVSKEVPEKILQAVEEESQAVLPYAAGLFCPKNAPARVKLK